MYNPNILFGGGKDKKIQNIKDKLGNYYLFFLIKSVISLSNIS